MNYGKKKASKQQKNVTSKAAMKKKRAGVRLFKAMLLTCLGRDYTMYRGRRTFHRKDD